MAIKLDEKRPIVVLEINENKDNVEIVGWYTLDERNLSRIKRQAEKNGGELVMLSPRDKVESLSTPHNGLSSAGKVTNNQRELQANSKGNDVEATAKEHGVDAMWLSRYAEAMKEKNSAAASNAMHNMKVAYPREHPEEKKALMEREEIHGLLANRRLFEPIEKAIKEKYGDVDVLIEEYRKQVELERSVMEAARKRAEEEARKRKEHLEELGMLSDEEIDKRYAEALEKGDEATARKMLDEAARRKGYGDAESEYQGVGAWSAPSNPGYETDEARRNAVGDDTPDLNIEDMAAGYSNQPMDVFEHPEKYSQGSPTSKESGKAIQTAIDEVKSGKKGVKVKVYRTVPTSVKEGKLRNGDWVTPSRKYAEMHGESRLDGKYRIIETEVPVKELWWDSNDVNEWGYDNGKSYRYKNAKNNRKLSDLVTRDDKGNVIPPSKRFNSRKADERYQKTDGTTEMSEREKTLRDAVVETMKSAGLDVSMDVEEGQRVLDEANGEVRMQAKMSALTKAANSIRNWLTGNKRNKVFTIELPQATQRMVRNVMGRDFDSHNITANGIAHAKKNHGVNGTKLTENSIPLRDADFELIPYIMTAPSYVRKGTSDKTGRESIRFYKELGNGYVVVAEKEYKNSPNDMETITMWAELSSSEATNARRNAPDTHVQNAILSTEDAAKIRKDAENAIENDVNIRKQRVYHGSGADITDHVRFFRTKDGEAYGYTVGGKIYIDPRIANSETPVHEYAHLWATALRSGNAEEWKNVAGLMKGTSVWEEVKKRYPELKTDDDIADEVLATYSGRRGAERLREEMDNAKGDAKSVLQRVKEAIERFWKATADMLHIHYTSAEEVADRVMKDLLDGVDPRKIVTSSDPIEGMKRAAEAFRKEEELKLQNRDKDANELFLSLQNKKGKEYYDTVTELANRVKQGTARIVREGEGAESSGSVNRRESLPAIAGKILNAANKQGDGQSTGLAGEASDKQGEKVLHLAQVYGQIEQWAKENGCYFTEDDIAKDSLDGKVWNDEGAEATIYRSKDGKSVIKVMSIDHYYNNAIDYYHDRNNHFNEVFPDTAIEVVGYGRDSEGRPSIIYKQPLVEGKTVYDYFNGDGIKANEYIDNMLAEMGYDKKVAYDDFGLEADSNGKYNLFDVNYTNVLIDKNGKPHVIDAEVLPIDYKNDGKIEIKDNEQYGAERSNDGGTRYRKGEASEESVQRDNATKRKAVDETVKKSGSKVNVHESVDDIDNPEVKSAIEHGENVKGWYDTKTGEVHLYMPNVTDKYDAQKTIAHETIGHKGMRGLLGEQGYRELMRNLYTHMSKEEAAEVNRRMMENGWDFYTAMDEYVADKAEDMVWNPKAATFWENVKHYVNPLAELI